MTRHSLHVERVAVRLFFTLTRRMLAAPAHPLRPSRQVLASANTSMSIPWPDVFATFLNTLKVAMLDLLTLTRTGCATPLNFYDNLLITLCLFAGGSAFGFVVLVVMDARQRRADAELHAQASAAAARMASPTAPKAGVGRQARQSVVQSAVEMAAEIPASMRGMRWGRVFKSLALFWTLCYPGACFLVGVKQPTRAFSRNAYAPCAVCV